MLSIRIRYGEKIQIGNATVVVKFIDSSKKAQMVIDAPKDVVVMRETAKKKVD